jgi:hypothetical protein
MTLRAFALCLWTSGPRTRTGPSGRLAMDAPATVPAVPYEGHISRTQNGMCGYSGSMLIGPASKLPARSLLSRTPEP